jgi:hypothetical protein
MKSNDKEISQQEARESIAEKIDNRKAFYSSTTKDGKNTITLFEANPAEIMRNIQAEGIASDDTRRYEQNHFEVPMRITDTDGVHWEYRILMGIDLDLNQLNPEVNWDSTLTATLYANKLLPWQEEYEENNKKIESITDHYKREASIKPEVAAEHHNWEGLLKEIPELSSLEVLESAKERVLQLQRERDEGRVVELFSERLKKRRHGK